MIQHEKTRGQRHAVNFGIVIAALYTIFATIFMVTLYRLAVAQTVRIQSLETVAGELAARVRRLENSFTAQKTGFKSVGETGHVLEEKSTRLKTKVGYFESTSFCKVLDNFVFKYYDELGNQSFFEVVHA